MGQKDSSWQLSAGIRETGLNKLTLAMGDRSAEIVERLSQDTGFAKAAGSALVGLLEGKPSAAPKRVTMDAVKSLMGGRCFLPDEAGRLLGLDAREVAAIPQLTGRQIEKVVAFLKGPCPITGSALAARTHILFPLPSTISGETFGVEWLLRNSGPKWKVSIEIAHRDRVKDAYHQQVRKPEWFLLYWGARDESAVPTGTDVAALKRLGYFMPELGVYGLAMGLQKRRSPQSVLPQFMSDGYYATLENVARVNRTVGSCLTVFVDTEYNRSQLKGESMQPALVRRVPLS
ncbi:MAG: hypothetical protein Q7R83_03280 [bacterium]|nr:hypothetical protein [bacterium]